VVGRVDGRQVVVAAVVARRRHEDLTVQPRVGNGGGQRLASGRPRPAVVGDLRAVGDGGVQRGDEIADRAVPVGVEELQVHQSHVPIDAGHRAGAGGADDPRDVGAVAVIVVGPVVVGAEVPADQVVGVAVVVVVDAVAPAAPAGVLSPGVLDHRR